MNKLTATTLTAMLALSLAACGSEDVNNPASSPKVGETTAAAGCLTDGLNKSWDDNSVEIDYAEYLSKLGDENVKAGTLFALKAQDEMYRDANLLAKEKGDSKPTAVDFEFANKNFTKGLVPIVKEMVVSAEQGDEKSIAGVRGIFPQVLFNTQPIEELDTLNEECIAFSINEVKVTGTSSMADNSLVPDYLEVVTTGYISQQGTKDGKDAVYNENNIVNTVIQKEDGEWKISGIYPLRLGGNYEKFDE